MEEQQNKLFVFERKEVVLIFLFVILIAVIAFTLGVRTGKSLSLKEDGYKTEDVKMIDLKSVTEEKVDSTVNDQDSVGSGEKPAGLDQNSIEQRIKDEMKKLAEEDVQVPQLDEESESRDEEITVSDQPSEATSNNPYAGKYTIQLSAHKSQETAQDFADAFIIKGFDMIINEAIIPGKGTWYRVSVGLFNTRQEALEYISEKKDLFQDREYTVNRL